jgi:peptide/nickel transport system substrate-binding protein
MRARRPVAFVAAIAVIVAACGSSQTPTQVPSSSAPPDTTAPSASTAAATPTAAPQRLSWAWNFVPTADWAIESDNATYLTQAGVTEPLVGVKVDGSVQPLLATSWQQLDPKTWEFTLRSGVKFQNGDPLDSAAVVKSLKYVLGVKTPPPALSPQDITSVTADGSDKVKIGTAQPNPLVPTELASGSAAILDAAAYNTDGTINPMKTGTGPFTMTASNLPQSISVDANPTYWGGVPGLAGADIKYITDGQTRVSLIQTGEVQLASAIPTDQLPVLKAVTGVTVTSQPIPRFTGLYFNNGRAPFNDVRVRQAVQIAIDSSAIATQVLAGGTVPASGPFRTTDAWSPQGAAPLAMDTTKATSLLAAAGVNPSTLHLTLLAYSDRAALPIVATAVQAMLAKIGIAVQIKVSTYNALEPSMLGGGFDMALVSRNYAFDSPDPLSFLSSDYSCKGTYNISHFCDAATDALLAQARTTADATARYAIYAQVAQKLQSDAVDVFIYDELNLQAYSNRLHGFQLYSNEEYFLTKDLSLDPAK